MQQPTLAVRISDTPARDALRAFIAAGLALAWLVPVVHGQALPEATVAEVAAEAREDADARASSITLDLDPGASPIAQLLEELGPSVRQYQAHITTLANPFFGGRDPGTFGGKLAADYVEHYFREAGLKPVFEQVTKAADGTEIKTPMGSFRQPFLNGETLTATRQIVRYTRAGQVIDLAQGQFSPLGYSGRGEVTAPLVFVGYSIPGEAKGGYRSYPQGFDLAGKIAIVLRFEPMNDEGRSLWTDRAWSPAAGLEPKIEAAFDRGAAGVIVVNPPGADDPRAGRLMTLETSEPSGEPFEGPVVMLSTEAADALVKQADLDGRSLLDLRTLADQSGAIIDLPAVSMTVGVQIDREPLTAQNVGGLLPGKGPLASEYIVIGAHYDHVGMGRSGSTDGARGIGKLHPGADDNASGTAGVLMLAERLTRQYAELPEGASARSIIFAAFDAEEQGLIGSRLMARTMPVPVEQAVFMLNLDMIGRLYDKNRAGEPQPLEVSGVDTGEGMEAWVTPILNASGLNIKIGNKSNDTQMLFARSDHFSFYQKKIPVMFFFTGLHNDYHSPRDVASKINGPGAVRVIELAEQVVMGVATRPERFPFTSRSSSAQASGTPAAEGSGQAAAASGASGSGVGGMKVRFGIMPGDYSGQDKGVLIGDVYEGTSAAEGGLKAGDMMVKWNESMLENVEEWMKFLAAANPGDEVTITYTRDGQEATTNVKLKARESQQPK
jgi:Zn-dependent M28 family amino/carboxypeptidase